MDQLRLFEEPVLDPGPQVRELAERLPKLVRFGTSSWTFPGWKGLVYGRPYPSQKDFVTRSLEEYARYPLFRTVGVDRSYYAPLTPEQVGAYGKMIPDSFVATQKAWSELTLPRFPNHPRYQDRAGQTNPAFLDPSIFVEQVLRPWRRLGSGAGPVVLQFTKGGGLGPRAFADALEEFFAQVPAAPYAVEIRERSHFTERYRATPRNAGAVHVLNYQPGMPSIAEQASAVGPPSGFVFSRVVLPPNRRYEEQKAAFAPFDKIVVPQPQLRSELVQVLKDALRAQVPAFVIVNNKAEGCSPLTIRALAEELVER